MEDHDWILSTMGPAAKNILTKTLKPTSMQSPPRSPGSRTFKVVIVRDNDGAVLAVKHRDPIAS